MNQIFFLLLVYLITPSYLGDPGEALYLTDIIADDPLEAQKRAKVEGDGILGEVESYAGYFTVNKEYQSNLFFWYFPAETNVENAPVALWLQGGPGASSLLGLFNENGPFEFGSDGQLKKRKYNWNHDHHLIYIDNPVGSGFSFTKNEKGYANNEKEVGENLYEAISQFFQMFPNLQKNPFFITGESYAGKYIPALGYTIHRKKKDKKEKVPINLKGLTIGNGLCDPVHQLKYGDYLYQLGFIDDNGLRTFHREEAKIAYAIRRRDFQCAFEIFNRLISVDDVTDGTIFKNLTGLETRFNFLQINSDMKDFLGDFVQSIQDIRRAIHVGNNTFYIFDDLTIQENKAFEHLKLDLLDSVAPWISELLNHYSILFYNGQLDIIVAYPLTTNFLKHLKFEGDVDYKRAPRNIWKVDGEVAGYFKESHNLVEVLVRNAGHMAPADQQKWVMDMILRFTHEGNFIGNNTQS